MFKKIQKYLLLHYPLLWNTKIVPMGVAVIGINLLFYVLGFLSGEIDFGSFSYRRYANVDSHFTYILITGFTSVLVLIIWLISYLKNNAFKYFYPKKHFSLYEEWCIIFILIFGNVLYLCSYIQGTICRVKSYTSEEEIQKISGILTMAEVLIPESDYNYYLRTENDGEGQPDARDSISISLLNFNTQYLSRQDEKNVERVTNWLKNGKQDSIRTLMTEYMDLQKKHGLKTNLTVSSWMERIYRPPLFPVSSSVYIHKSESFNGEPYTEYNNLSFGYGYISDAYHKNPLKHVILVSLYVSLFVSILLFSFRITSRKSWLTALVSAGLLCFINGIISIILGTSGVNDDNLFTFALVYWSSLFAGSAIYIYEKIFRKSGKGKSAVILNIFLWILPFICLLHYIEYMNGNYYDEKNYTPVSKFFKDNPILFFWINLIFVIVLLFFLTKMLKKWRALPEE